MAKDDESKGLANVDVGIEIPGVGGAHVKVGANEGLVKYVAPELYRAQRAFDTLIRGIELKQDRGEELSPQDNQLLAVSAMPILSGKLENVAAVIGKAQQLDPDFGRYVSGKVPLAEAPKGLPAAETGDELDIEVTIEDQQTEYWWDRFWADAENVSVEYMQDFLAKVAVRKRKSDSGFSLRTLDVLRCLEPNAAAIFNRFGQFVWSDGSAPAAKQFQEQYDRAGLGYGEISELEEAGLITLGDVAHMFGSATIGGHEFTCLETADQPAQVPIIVLTRAGRDLFQLITPKPPERYVLAVGRYIQNYVSEGDILWRKPDSDRYEKLPPEPDDEEAENVIFPETHDHEKERV